jgi:hypothetical protein
MIAVTCDRVRELASGFVLGALDTDEMIAVAAHLDSCAEEHPEVYEFGGVVPYLAESLQPVEPPSWLRESVIAAARADLSARRRAAKAEEPRTIEPVALPRIAAPAAGVTSITVARVSRRRRAMTWSMRAAAAVAILVLTGTGIVVQGNLAKALKAQQEDTTLNYALTQHDTRSAVMASTAGSKAGGIAALLPTGHIILKLYGLAPTRNDEVYTAWITTDQGGPTKVGSFTPEDNGSGFLEVDNVPTSASLLLYVSKEPSAKVTQPTGPIIVSGMVNL